MAPRDKIQPLLTNELTIINVGLEGFAEDMAAGNVTFAATGVSEGPMLKGVRLSPGGAITHSMVMRSRTGTFRFIEGHHDFTRIDG